MHEGNRESDVELPAVNSRHEGEEVALISERFERLECLELREVGMVVAAE